MAATGWTERFLASTRGRVVALLRRGETTVEDLARALNLTDNAVRSHLAALERDGLVDQVGIRRGTRKPSHTYALTDEADLFFPKAYATLIHLLLDSLADRLPPDAVAALLRDVGHRLAITQPAPSGELRTRVDHAVGLLGELGGAATVEEGDNCLVIQGSSCPLAALVNGHPESCLLAETLLADVIGASVHQVCDPDVPRCRFEIACPPAAPERGAAI